VCVPNQTLLPPNKQGRDANKKLQRALRAQRLRDRLPALAAAARAALDGWREAEGAAFLYDGCEYEVRGAVAVVEGGCGDIRLEIWSGWRRGVNLGFHWGHDPPKQHQSINTDETKSAVYPTPLQRPS
jgi:hypothetical protein